jgi:hypothetical protein
MVLFQAVYPDRVNGTKSRRGKYPLMHDPDDEHADAQMLDVGLGASSERRKHA